MLLSLAVLLLLAPQPAPSQRAGAPAPRRPSGVEASPRPEPSEETSGTDAPAATLDKTKEREAPREKEEAPVVTRHEARVGGRTLRYTVTTGMMPLKNEAGETEASVFYMAYVVERAGGPEKRPLTFSFNGGPRSSPVWLHLGALRPQRARLLQEGGT